MKFFKSRTLYISIFVSLGVGLYLLSTDSYTQAKFRTMQDSIEASEKVDLTGLRDLQVSGGPVPDFSELKEQLAHVKQKIIVVDTIRHFHGYIKTPLHSETPTTLLSYDRGKPDLRHKMRRILLTGSLEKKVDQVVPEKETAEKYGFDYEYIIIDSRIKTPDPHVDEFVAFMDSLPENVWVHFHCRLGKGRTSMALIMYDIMKNAPQVSLDDIVHRQHLLGSENLLDVSHKEGGTYDSCALIRRKQFIEDFYKFVTQRKAGGIQKWSVWHASQK